MVNEFNAELLTDAQTCPAVGYQSASICVPVTVTPFAQTGVTVTKCCGDPVVTPGREVCGGIKNGSCFFTITQDITKGYVRLKMECKDYILAQKTAIDALRFDPKDSELNMYAILAMGFQGNLSMAQTYYTAAKPYLALEHAEVIKKYLNIK